MDDPRMRFRVWVDAQLVDEAWIDVSKPNPVPLAETVRERHAAIAATAEEQGRAWLVEVFDPAKPTEGAYLRLGTDPTGMVDPRPIQET